MRVVFTSLLVAFTLVSASSHAAAFQVQAQTEAQAYQIRSYRGSDPSNPTFLPRRRLTQYLGLSGYELLAKQDLSLETNLRVTSDFGLPRSEAAFIDGLRAQDVELLYAHLNYRVGRLESSLGRQIYVDLMDFAAFDGARVRYVSKYFLGAEAYAGLWVKGAGFLASPVYQLDGTRETDARRLSAAIPGADPSLAAIEPLLGGKLLLENFKGATASLGYRRSHHHGKLTFERSAAEFAFNQGRGISALAGAEMDMVRPRLSQFRSQLRLDRELFATTFEVFRVTPILSTDSIWYYFATGARDEARARLDFYPAGPLRYHAQLVGALYRTELQEAYLEAVGSDGSARNAGAGIGAVYQRGNYRGGLDLLYRTGYGGRQLWIDLTSGYAMLANKFRLDGRVSVASLRDANNPLLRGNFYGLQVWGSYALTRLARFSLVAEENVNQFSKFDSKVFAVFELRTWL